MPSCRERKEERKGLERMARTSQEISETGKKKNFGAFCISTLKISAIGRSATIRCVENVVAFTSEKNSKMEKLDIHKSKGVVPCVGLKM